MVSFADCVTSTAEAVSHQIPVIRIFIRIAHRSWTPSDIFLCFLRLIIFLNLQVQRFVAVEHPPQVVLSEFLPIGDVQTSKGPHHCEVVVRGVPGLPIATGHIVGLATCQCDVKFY